MLKSQRAVYLQLAGFAIAIIAFAFLSRFFPIVGFVGDLQHRVAGMGAWSALWYPLLFAACNILLLPGGILSVGAGFFFGLWWGFAIVFVGNAIGAAISFALSRWLAAYWFRRRFADNPTLQALEPAVEREGWKIIFL